MHATTIPQYLKDRVVARRGKEHIFDDLKASETALIVVDLQNAFMLPGVAHAYVERAAAIVPNVNRLAATTRLAGGQVVWIKTVWEPKDQEWSVLDAMSLKKWTSKRQKALERGSKGWELWGDLDVLSDKDIIVEKTRFSAFIQGSSELDAVLKALGLRTLLITGTATNVCCESTARDAMMLNYKTVMIDDANAASTDEEHSASINAFYAMFGDVMSTDFAIECLQKNV
jgi:ureidoacrylate peracid hydrolase